MPGIHLPKKIECIGSDGQTYAQLVKSHDDLRKDAVLQQVFGVMEYFATAEPINIATKPSDTNIQDRSHESTVWCNRVGRQHGPARGLYL